MEKNEILEKVEVKDICLCFSENGSPMRLWVYGVGIS